jgi:hypothetical protein
MDAPVNDHLERRVQAVAAELRTRTETTPKLSADVAEERARNIVQSLVDEDIYYHPSVQEVRRELAVREALVNWKLAPRGWRATLDVQSRVLKALADTHSSK